MAIIDFISVILEEDDSIDDKVVDLFLNLIKNKLPHVSIITPFRNAENFIQDTAQSIFDQSLKDWEWILVNDHSTQNENAVLADYLKDHRVKIMHNEGVGIVDALCTAQKVISGRFITRMDADDKMPENKLQLFVSVLQTELCDVVTGKVNYFVDNGALSEGYKSYEKWLNAIVDNQDFYTEIYKECTLASGNWMMKTESFLKHGGFNDLVYPEDYDLLLRWYKSNLVIKGIDKVTHFWRDHADRTSKNSANYHQKQFFELKINRFIEIDFCDQPIVLNGTGQKGRLVAKILLNRNVPFEWVSHEPGKYVSGIFGQSIKECSAICYIKPIILLNTTLIPEQTLRTIYPKELAIDKIINL
jgi:glycosyltransferase involved in cell wall biosynthesis